MGFVPIDYNAIGKNHSRNHNHPCYHKHNRNFIQTLLSNDLTIGCPIIYTDIYSHNTIVLKDTSNNAWYNQVHWLIGTPYLSIIAGSGLRAEIKTGLLTDIVSRDILFCDILYYFLVAGSLEAAYSLNWGAREVWGKGGGETLALL